MYSQRISLFAAPGKAPEIREILEQRTRERQAKGIRSSLSTAAFSLEPCLVLSAQFDDLGALEAFRASELGQPDPRIAPLTRQTARSELYESLLQVPAASTPARFIQRVTNTPLPGKGREIQEIVVERAKARQAEGTRAGVSVQAAGPASGTVVTTTVFASLVEFEKQRARNQSDRVFQEFGQRLASLIARTPIVELFEVIIPLPPRQ